MITISLMDIALAAVGDDAAIRGDQSPPPVALNVNVLLKLHALSFQVLA